MNVFQVVQRTIIFCFSKDYYNVQMFSKLKSSTWFQVPANVEVVQSGYMYKSPPQTLLFRSLKSWKRRYFVLSKTTANHYELKFFKDENRREKPLGQINLYQISLFYQHAESHPNWLWIHRTFRCSPSCVLYMKVRDRDYFLIGENSSDTEDWFNAIFKALNTHPTTMPGSEEMKKIRSVSEPSSVLYRNPNWSEEQKGTKQNSSSRQSAPESVNAQYSHYDYPRNYMMTASQCLESEDTDEDEEDEMKANKESQTARDSSYYMDMKSVYSSMHRKEVLSLSPEVNLEGNNASENSFLQTANEDSGYTAPNKQISPGSETFVPVKKDICVSQDELKNSMIFSEDAGRLCVSSWRQTQSSSLFHEGDQILAINDLLTVSLVDLQTYLKRLTKDEVKVTILRQPGSQPLTGCCT